MAKHRPVLIAGGGIGGLSTAIALARAGFNSTVLERSSFTEESGAGIQLGPNATRLLRELGILDAIASSAFTPEAIFLFDGVSGRKLATIPLGAHAERRYGAPYLTLHRADLHAGLRASADALAPVTLTSGFDVAGIEASDETVAVANIDGTMAEGAALVGADGLWSTVRNAVAPDAQLHFSGATAFRALLPLSGLPSPFSAPVVGLWLGPKAHLVHYPVRGGEALNVVAVIEGGGEAQGWNREGDRDSLLSGFTRWCKESKSLLEGVGAWRAWSLYRLSPLASWSQGPITLLGDAAHPVLPYLAQGAALAIEDAATLADALAAERHDPASAFARYEAVRRPRATRLQRTSRRFGWIYHVQGPARFARNLVLASRDEETALDRFDWLYGEAALNSPRPRAGV
jgi:2-polyprenyl-6-methoxyphenol hydroxylase-like FAD-dependent oxidoreductase